MGRPRSFDAESAVESAMQTFWTKGYAATTPTDLCEHTGLGKGSLYNAFGGKRDLFELALEHYCQGVGLAQYEIALSADAPIRERIRTIMLEIARPDTEAARQRGCMAINTAIELGFADEAAARQVGRHFERIEDKLSAALGRAQRDHEIDMGRDPRALARFVMSSLYGMHVLGRTTRDPQRLVDIVDTTVAAL